ncbi:MAG: ATP-binding cassette domain-containing protein [Hyphomicrobiaceae bacterium]
MLAKAPAALITFSRAGFTVGDSTLLSDISLTIDPGAPTILLGPNGAGKTTLLKLAMGLLAATTGKITDRGANDAPSRKAFVFQKPVMLRRSAADNIAFALVAARRPAGEAPVQALLAQVGLSAVADRPARKLSGGEQQRLSLARALARSPEILLLDEPTASLDPASTKAVEDIIGDVAAGGVKVIMSTHDLGEAKRLAGDIVFLSGGRLVEHSPASVFFKTPQSEAARRFLAGELLV